MIFFFLIFSGLKHLRSDFIRADAFMANCSHPGKIKGLLIYELLSQIHTLSPRNSKVQHWLNKPKQEVIKAVAWQCLQPGAYYKLGQTSEK